SLEPQSGGGYLIRTAAVLPHGGAGRDPRFVVALYQVPGQLAALTEAVQSSYNEYGNLAAMREPLKYSFRLTLTLVVLLTMLAAIYLAIFSAQRLVRPVQDLIEGTRAVGKGDFATRLPLPSRDEMGFLVHSFNDMTKKLRRARAEATQSREAVERERTRLAIILARLSTGVLAIDRALTVRTANEAAGAILGTDLSAATGRPLPELAAGNERLGQFVAALAVRFAAGREEWREQLDLDGSGGRRTLMCACTPLPGEDSGAGFVIVFDDITALLAAQRDAAWGEVARRLAHEIKNPLTPIQLSAERLRRKYGKTITEDRAIFEQCTDTIVRQVEDIRRMVDEFSRFARMPKPVMTAEDAADTVRQVVFLMRVGNADIDIDAELADEKMPARFDRRLISQALTNIIKNATEAVAAVPPAELGGRGRIHVSAAREEGDIVIDVVDNGIGLPKENRSRLLEPYVTTREKGTGLGLAIVGKILEDHGGRIELRDAADKTPGARGAWMRLRFAAAAVAPPSDADEAAESSELSTEPSPTTSASA
ncbi:MAG TPA: ATP-binding protein, partial [Xanthobacteraceae bacterium]|nr:ATP-binding protein [Xanthobacteraceae bacterium]